MIPSPKERFDAAVNDAKLAFDGEDEAEQRKALYDLGVVAWNLAQAISAGLDLAEWAKRRRLKG